MNAVRGATSRSIDMNAVRGATTTFPCPALGVNKENLLRVVGKTNFRILKRNSDVVFDAEHEFRIRISF